MKSATTNTSAIDHFAIASTKPSTRRRRTASAMKTAHSTSAAFATGTTTLKSRMSVAGIGLCTS